MNSTIEPKYDFSKGDEKLVFFLKTVSDEAHHTEKDDHVTMFLTVTSKLRGDLLIALGHLNTMINKEGLSSAMIEIPVDCLVFRNHKWISDAESMLTMFNMGLLVEEFPEMDIDLVESDTAYLKVWYTDSPAVSISYSENFVESFETQSTFLNALADRIFKTLV